MRYCKPERQGDIMVDEATRRRVADGEACFKWARLYLSLKWAVLPLCYPDHVGFPRQHTKDCQTPGKRPWIRWKQYEDELPAESDLSYWWNQYCSSNVGIALGPVSGLIRVDVEGEAGLQALLTKSRGDLPRTLEFMSGRTDQTGKGMLYKIPAGVTLRTTRDTFGPKQELRFQARGAQTVLPPSRHASGSLYSWLPGQGPEDIEVALAPEWLIRELLETGNGRSGDRPARNWEELFGGVSEGARNDTMAAIIGKLVAGCRDIKNGSDLQAIWLAVEAINERHDPPLDDEELEKVFHSIVKAEKRKREEQDLGALDRHMEQVVERSAKAKENGHKSGNGSSEERPVADLQIVKTDPRIYRLRTHYWSDAPALATQDGYLELTKDQILNWSTKTGIHEAAFWQAERLVPIKIKNWSTPGGHLEKLLENATIVEVEPESNRKLQILGFLYRYLWAARPPKEPTEEGKPISLPATGRPTLREDGSVVFKFDHLTEATHEAKLDCADRELAHLLKEAGLRACKLEGSRWWRAEQPSIDRIGCITQEGSSESPDILPG